MQRYKYSYYIDGIIEKLTGIYLLFICMIYCIDND